MTQSTSRYLQAMQALNDFYAILYQSMLSAMPEALLSATGAYVWRGYRIDSFKNLASCQYYCQIYPESPSFLVFQESYQYKGKYYHHVQKQIDLLEERFFLKSLDEQLSYSTDFVRLASNTATIWQDSEDRKTVVPKDYLSGTNINRHKLKGKFFLNQVPDDFIYAFPMQDRLFQLLIPGIRQACETVLSKKVDLLPNASWYNWDFRGYRMKFLDSSGEKPRGPSDYVWRIYYKEPAFLTCERYKGKDYPEIPPFHLSPDFLSASEQEQSERLHQFALQSMQIR